MSKQYGILLVSGNYTTTSGQSIVNEEVIENAIEGCSGSVYIVRGRSRKLPAQILLVLEIISICLRKRISTVYYAPSRTSRGIFRDLLVYVFSGAGNKRLIVHWHGADLVLYKRRSLLIRMANYYLQSAEHIGLCTAHRDMITSVWPAVLVSIIANAPSRQFLSHLATLSHGQNDGRSQRMVVSFIGGLRLEKGIDVFCEIADKFAGEDYEFRAYGRLADMQGNFSESIAHVIAHSKTVDYRGEVRGIAKAEAFWETDVLLFPSRFEAYPLVVLEALAAGCCVVSSRVGFVSAIEGGDRLALVDSSPMKAESYVPAFLSFRREQTRNKACRNEMLLKANEMRECIDADIQRLLRGDN